MNLYEKKQAWILGGFEYLHADDVVANAGSGGATFRTDQLAGGQHVPFAKLMSGTADDTAVIPGDATNGLYVQVKASAAVPVTDNSSSLTVDSAQLPATLGQKTMANAFAVSLASDQSSIPVTDGSGSLTMDSAQLPATLGQKAMTASLPVVLASDQASVPVAATLQAGTAAIGKLAANSGVDIGDVDVTSGPTGASAFQVQGTAAADAAVVGNPVVGGGRASAAAPTDMSADGDVVSSWHLRNGSQVVNLAAGGALIGATSNALDVNIKSGAGSGGTALADKAGFTEGTTSFTPVGGVYNETISADPTEDQAAAVRITAKRALHVNLRDSSGNELTSGAQYAEDSVHASGDMVTMAGVVRKDTAAQVAGTDGDVSCLVNDASGRLHVNVGALPSGTVAGGSSLPAGTNNIGDVDVLTVPTDPFGANADAASATGSISAKLRFIASTGIPITGTVTVGSHAVTNAGTFAVQAAQSGTWTVQPGNTQNTTAWLVTDIPATSGGWTSSILLSAATTNATSLKGSAGQLGGWYLYNANAAVRYLKFYNKATSPTVGTDTPVLVIPIPPGSAANVEFGKGIAFGTGIAYAITTGVANSDTGAVAANEIVVNLFYK